MAQQVVTVFGGSGFVGRHVVRRLAAQGFMVRVAVRDTESALFLKTQGGVGQIVPCATNILDNGSIEAAVADADQVINLVGILYESGKSRFDAIHHAAAGNIASAAAAAGVSSFVQVSAIGASPDSSSSYARSKAAGETAVLEAFPTAVILRPSLIFGPEDGFFNLFAGICRISPFLPVFGCPLFPRIKLFPDGGLVSVDLYGDGGTKFQPVYVGDVADAVVTALGSSDAAGQLFELGGPDVYSSKALMELLLSVVGRRRWLAPIPFWALSIKAWFLEKLPKPFITTDQVRLLRTDNVVSEDALTLADLGITACKAEVIMPTYLTRFRLPRQQQQHPA